MFNTSIDGRGEDMDMQFATLWELTADMMLDNPALICGDSVRSWKEYEDRAARLAMLLTKHGLGDDSKVGLYLHNNNEYLEAQFSVFKIRFKGCFTGKDLIDLNSILRLRSFDSTTTLWSFLGVSSTLA